jgi:hypothetical protein
VHAPVQARELGEVAEESPPADAERVEQPHRDVGVSVERGQDGIEAGGVLVVQQEPHAHAAVGRPADRLEQQGPRHVVAPEVVLRVQRPLGRVGQEDAGRERAAAVGQRDHAGPAGVRLDERRDHPAEPRVSGVG